MKAKTKRGFTLHYNQVLAISFAYLVLPFLIFCLGFIKIYLALPVVLLFAWLAYRNFLQHSRDERQLVVPFKTLAVTLALTLIWVWLSGIGGFAFQNNDFHYRNAILRDLITHDWPVRYFNDPLSPNTPYTLIYYFGFWLPSALVGKIGGWLAANIALFLWTEIGVLLVLCLVAFKVKLSLPKLLLLFVFFSGMDALGSLIKLAAIPGGNNPFWPPITHLEWWGVNMQYSSFTTQLFWIFNQAVPAWIVLAILMTLRERKTILLAWALSCFFSPLIAIGMFPYLLLKLPQQLFDAERMQDTPPLHGWADFWRRSWADIKALLSPENVLGGGLVLVLSMLYFDSNVQTGVQVVSLGNNIYFCLGLILFVPLEGLILWKTVSTRQRNNLLWYLAGILLIITPIFRLGSGQEFYMRPPIPISTLFLLLIWSGEELVAPPNVKRSFLILLLCIGALTPLFEINRTVYRTYGYLFNPPSAAEKWEGQQIKIYKPIDDEHDHPYTLVADSFKSLANLKPNDARNFLATINENSIIAQIIK